MRLALVLLVLLAADVASADRERPQTIEEPRPCKCIRRDPQLSYDPVRERDPFAARVASRARAYNSGVFRCFRQHTVTTADLTFAFAKRATEPRVTAVGAPALGACLAKLTWHSFDEAPRATTVRVRVSDRFGL